MKVRPGAVLGVVAPVVLSGCSLTSLASQDKPICSWVVNPPPNASHLCTVGFTTLRTLARYDLQGNQRGIRRLVSSPAIAAQIITYGQHARSLGVRNLHVMPSIVLDITQSGLLGASSSLIGTYGGNKLHDTFTIYMRLRGNTARVVGHDPGYAW